MTSNDLLYKSLLSQVGSHDSVSGVIYSGEKLEFHYLHLRSYNWIYTGVTKSHVCFLQKSAYFSFLIKC